MKKKIWPEYFEEVASGRKKFEFRAADFDLKEGDILTLEEYDPRTKEYTGRIIEKKVGHVSKFNLNDFGQRELLEKHGFYIISLE